MTRYDANKKILYKIQEMVEKGKDLRFCQILCNLNLPYFYENNVDSYNEESEETLKKINGRLD